MEAINPLHLVQHNGVHILVYHANLGQGLPKHSHLFSHLVLCHAGRIVITKEAGQLEMTSTTQSVNLRANEWHEIEALEDGTVFVNIAFSTPA